MSHTKRVCALRSSARYGRLLKETKQGSAIDRQAVTEPSTDAAKRLKAWNIKPPKPILNLD